MLTCLAFAIERPKREDNMKTIQVNEIERDAIVGHLRVAADSYVSEALGVHHESVSESRRYQQAAISARNLASQLEALPMDGAPVVTETFPVSNGPAKFHGDPLRTVLSRD